MKKKRLADPVHPKTATQKATPLNPWHRFLQPRPSPRNTSRKAHTGSSKTPCGKLLRTPVLDGEYGETSLSVLEFLEKKAAAGSRHFSFRAVGFYILYCARPAAARNFRWYSLEDSTSLFLRACDVFFKCLPFECYGKCGFLRSRGVEDRWNRKILDAVVVEILLKGAGKFIWFLWCKSITLNLDLELIVFKAYNNLQKIQRAL